MLYSIILCKVKVYKKNLMANNVSLRHGRGAEQCFTLNIAVYTIISWPRICSNNTLFSDSLKWD